MLFIQFSSDSDSVKETVDPKSPVSIIPDIQRRTSNEHEKKQTLVSINQECLTYNDRAHYDHLADHVIHQYWKGESMKPDCCSDSSNINSDWYSLFNLFV